MSVLFETDQAWDWCAAFMDVYGSERGSGSCGYDADKLTSEKYFYKKYIKLCFDKSGLKIMYYDNGCSQNFGIGTPICDLEQIRQDTFLDLNTVLKWDINLKAEDMMRYEYSSEHSDMIAELSPHNWSKIMSHTQRDCRCIFSIHEKEHHVLLKIETEPIIKKPFRNQETVRFGGGCIVPLYDKTQMRFSFRSYISLFSELHHPSKQHTSGRVLIKIDDNCARMLPFLSDLPCWSYLSRGMKIYCDNTGIKFRFDGNYGEFKTFSIKAKDLLTYEYSFKSCWDLERLLPCFLPKDIISKIIDNINSITGEISGIEYMKILKHRSVILSLADGIIECSNVYQEYYF